MLFIIANPHWHLILVVNGLMWGRHVKDHLYSHWSLLPGYCVVNVWGQTTIAESKFDGSLVEDNEYEDISRNKKLFMPYIYI